MSCLSPFFEDIPLTELRQATISHKGFLSQILQHFLCNFCSVVHHAQFLRQEIYFYIYCTLSKHLHLFWVSINLIEFLPLKKCFDFPEIRISKFCVKTIFAFEKTSQSNGPFRNISGKKITFVGRNIPLLW